MVDEVVPVESSRARLLDDPSLYEKLDPTGLRLRLRGLPDQCRDAWGKAMAFTLPREYARVEHVVVAGMGGSAIGGNLLADLSSLEEAPPISICRDYQVPRYVDERTLVLACSYSGDTEETLSAFRQALEQGAKVVAVTGGGCLAAEARKWDVPLFLVEYEGEPRSAIGYSFLVPTVLLMKLGLISDKGRDCDEALHVLENLVAELGEESPSHKNPAKGLAAELLDRLIVVYGSGLFSAVALRWKTQLNENAKAWAFAEFLPEAHHNSVVGYTLPAAVKALAFAVLLLPGILHPRTRHRYRVTEELLEMESIPHRTLEGRGDGALSQMLSTILIGDYTSYYLALLQGVEPAPVTAVDFVKSRIADLT